MTNAPFVERSKLLNSQINVERSIIALRERTLPFSRISPIQTTKIFDAAHTVVCKAIEKASDPRNESLAYTDIALSMIRSVNASRLPGSKQMARELAHEFMLNSRRMMDVCTTDCERNFRADHIVQALELTH